MTTTTLDPKTFELTVLPELTEEEALEALLENYAGISALITEERDALDETFARLMGDYLPEWTAAEAHSEERIEGLLEELKTLRAEITEMVTAREESYKLDGYYQAVYTPGKVKWNSDKLEGMAAFHPAINQARTVGSPTVTIRKA